MWWRFTDSSYRKTKCTHLVPKMCLTTSSKYIWTCSQIYGNCHNRVFKQQKLSCSSGQRSNMCSVPYNFSFVFFHRLLLRKIYHVICLPPKWAFSNTSQIEVMQLCKNENHLREEEKEKGNRWKASSISFLKQPIWNHPKESLIFIHTIWGIIGSRNE